MLIYNLRERRLQFKDGIRPRFPANAIVHVAPAPSVPFGGAAGFTRNSVRDQTLIARANLSTGRFLFESKEPLFESLDASIAISGTTFQIKKNIARVQSRCRSEQDLGYLIATLFYAFPAVLNVYLPDAPHPTHAWGLVGSDKFQWLFEPTQVRASMIVTSKEGQENLVTESWRQVATVAASRRLMGGLHYFHVACRLLVAGYNRFEFMAEALLNLSKSLQSLFGQSRDDIRAELVKLDSYTNDEIEGKFVPALVLRDEFNVAHVSLALLTQDQLKILHKYTNMAEHAFRDLLRSLLEKVEEGEYVLPPDTPPILHKKKKDILKRLEKKIRPFD